MKSNAISVIKRWKVQVIWKPHIICSQSANESCENYWRSHWTFPINWAPKDLHCSLRDKATCAAKFPAWETLCHFLPERMRSHIGCIYLTFLCCVYLMCPKVALWRGCKVTSVAFVWFFSTVCFQMCPQIARLRGCIVALVACVLMWILKLPT